MVRLRLLRILLPALLVPIVVLLVLTFRPRPTVLGVGPSDRVEGSGPRAERVEVTEIWTGNRRLFVRAGHGNLDADGKLHLEGVERAELDRAGKSPLVLRAERGVVEGPPGGRRMRLEGGIEARDEEAGARFLLPSIEVDEARNEARSDGDVRFEGSGYRGHATALVYDLAGDRPSEIENPAVEGLDGSRLSASRALLRGERGRLELDGTVRLAQGPTTLEADRLEIERSPEGRPRSALATGDVRCDGFPIAAVPARFRAGRLRIEWDADGSPARASAEERPHAARGDQFLEADTLELSRRPGGTHWDLEARGHVLAGGTLELGAARLSADRVVAEVGDGGRLVAGEASGSVRFEAGETSGEASRATLESSGADAGTVRLFSEGGPRARLARDRTRIAARTIVTDTKGIGLDAQGQVEASLLAGPRGPDAPAGPSALFSAGQAVHFVAERLTGSPAEGRLAFRGTVRGWQGERSLAAEIVELDQKKDELHARDQVSSRFPRQGVAAAEADFVQITSERLDYSGSAHRGVYEGQVKVRLSEGRLEGNTLEADLDERGATREMRMSGDVRFEMKPAAGREADGPVTGRGDRVAYSTPERAVRLFGDAFPASVTRGGERGGTTTGRVLRYRLDTGTLEVEAEERESERAPERSRG